MAATMDDVLRELQTHTTYLRGGGNSSAQPSMKSAPSAPLIKSALGLQNEKGNWFMTYSAQPNLSN